MVAKKLGSSSEYHGLPYCRSLHAQLLPFFFSLSHLYFVLLNNRLHDIGYVCADLPAVRHGLTYWLVCAEDKRGKHTIGWIADQVRIGVFPGAHL
jgi:hypothetical protein